MGRFLVSALLAASALAQDAAPPAFEVASVKINRQDPSAGRVLKVSGDTLTIRNLNLKMIAAWAYNLQWSQMAGPPWIDSDCFDIIAKAAKPSSEDEMRPMLQALLAERFHFASHRETRRVEALVFTVANGGHKMTPSKKTGPAESHQDPVRGTVIEGLTLAQLCEELSHNFGGTPVVDMTGLTGRFDFALNIRKYVEAARGQAMSEPRPSEAELRMSVLQDMVAGELGLKAELRKAPVEFLVIDRADQTPTEN